MKGKFTITPLKNKLMKMPFFSISTFTCSKPLLYTIHLIYICFLFLGSLTQAIRNFAKGLESWLSAAMAGCPSDMVDIKVRISLTLFTLEHVIYVYQTILLYFFPLFI